MLQVGRQNQRDMAIRSELVTDGVWNFDAVAVHEYNRRFSDSMIVQDETVF